MGIQTNSRTPPSSLADAVFSGTRQRLIGLLFGQVGRSFYATELSGIARKTIGLADPLREAHAPLVGKIRAAFVYGSIAKRTDTASSDIDVLLLSDELACADVFAALEAATSTLARTVNPTILTSAELRKRVENEESVLTRVPAQPRIRLIGGEDALAI